MADQTRDPAAPHSHLIAFPEALEAFYTRVGELRVILGPRAAAGVDGLEALMPYRFSDQFAVSQVW